MGWVYASQLDDLEMDEMKRVRVGGIELLLYRMWDGFFATSTICTHEHKSLSKGWMYRGCIVCPRHSGSFDIRTGKAVASPCVLPIETYATRVQGNEIWVQLNDISAPIE